MPPLRDGVRLIDNEEGHAGRFHFVQELAFFEALGGDIKQLGGASLECSVCLFALCFRQRGVDFMHVNVSALRLCLLVLHEGNQRRHHHDGMRQEERGQLIGERFACACGHDCERVPPVEDGLQHFALCGAESGDTEAALRLPLEVCPWD